MTKVGHLLLKLNQMKMMNQTRRKKSSLKRKITKNKDKVYQLRYMGSSIRKATLNLKSFLNQMK